MSASSGPSIRPLSASNTFGWTFDFEFLINKARYELDMSMTQHINWFFPNAMNFCVSVHAIADYMWHTKAIREPQWSNSQNKFIEWCKGENSFIAAFIDLSNTYKHSDRYKKNQFIDRLELKTFPDEWIKSRPPEELRNRIKAPLFKNDVQSGYLELWPILAISGSNIYFHYAAESVLHWWRTYHSSNSQTQNSTPP